MINKEDLKYPLIILFCIFILVIFHVWFSSFVDEDDWRRPTPIPDRLENPYYWPPNVNYLGTPIQKIKKWIHSENKLLKIIKNSWK